MNNLISLGEPLVECPLPSGEVGEVYVTTDGSYDSQRGLLLLELGSAVRSRGAPVIEQRPGWLPKPQSLQEHVSLEEATAVAREVFRHWVEKVRRCIPSDLHVTYAANPS